MKTQIIKRSEIPLLLSQAKGLLEIAEMIKPKKPQVKKPPTPPHLTSRVKPDDRSYSFMSQLNFDTPAPNQYQINQPNQSVNVKIFQHDRTQTQNIQTSPGPGSYNYLPQLNQGAKICKSDKFQTKQRKQQKQPEFYDISEKPDKAIRINASERSKKQVISYEVTERSPALYSPKWK